MDLFQLTPDPVDCECGIHKYEDVNKYQKHYINCVHPKLKYKLFRYIEDLNANEYLGERYIDELIRLDVKRYNNVTKETEFEEIDFTHPKYKFYFKISGYRLIKCYNIIQNNHIV